jgi:hypothetical protein
MADEKITQLAADTSPSLTDLVASVEDPSGSPVTKKVTIATVLSLLNPIGTIREFNVATNPGTLLGFGTWTAYGAGRVTVGLDSGQTEFDTVDETGGAKTHTLSTAEMPAHTHSISVRDGTGSDNVQEGGNNASGTPNTGSTGGGSAHNNLQPYIVVYRWVRTA